MERYAPIYRVLSGTGAAKMSDSPVGVDRFADVCMIIFIVSGFTQKLVILMDREKAKSSMSSDTGSKKDVCSSCGQPKDKCNCK
jgi:hypothetical protein